MWKMIFFHKLKLTYIKFIRETIYLSITLIHLGNKSKFTIQFKKYHGS